MGIGVKGARRCNENRELSGSKAPFGSKVRQISKLGVRRPHPYIYADLLDLSFVLFVPFVAKFLISGNDEPAS
jgi:hypothetical protein